MKSTPFIQRFRSIFTGLTNRLKRTEKSKRNSVSFYYVIKVLRSCRTNEQIDSAYRYAILAGYGDNEVVNEWFRFKKSINHI